MNQLASGLKRLWPMLLALPLLGFDCGGGKECVYGGKTLADGATFPSQDGCNTCQCGNGEVLCTQKACAGMWFHTCGDPVCHDNGHRVDPNIPACTTQKVGDACTKAGDLCDPNDPCNVHLVCAGADPTKQPGGCPISRAKYKRDIRYLEDEDRDRQLAALMKLKLATYRYRAAGPDGPLQLGFIIDDVGAGPLVNADGETVNLYGYASTAVAAVQAQEKRIRQLEAEVSALRQLVSERPRRAAHLR